MTHKDATHKLKPKIILTLSFAFLNNTQLTYLDFQDVSSIYYNSRLIE